MCWFSKRKQYVHEIAFCKRENKKEWTENIKTKTNKTLKYVYVLQKQKQTKKKKLKLRNIAKCIKRDCKKMAKRVDFSLQIGWFFAIFGNNSSSYKL